LAYEAPTRQSLGQQRQGSQRPRHADALARGAQVEPDPPAQPGGAAPKSRVPALSRVELADEIKQPSARGVEVCRQLSDLVTQPVE
jgi:hypothetical protein